MRKLVPRLAAGVILILIAMAPLGPVTGEPLSLPAECK